MKFPKEAWRAPFSAAAAAAAGSIGAHFVERSLKTDDEWAQAAFWTMACVMGIITVMEILQVWQELGMAEEPS